MPFLHILVRLAAQFVNSFSVRLQFVPTNLSTGYRKYSLNKQIRLVVHRRFCIHKAMIIYLNEIRLVENF
jgi:hypothetical protein